MPGGIGMALPMTLVAGVLMFSGVQARDIADGSKNNGFLSKFMPLRSGSSKSSIGDNGKLMAHHLNHMKLGGQPQASLDHSDVAEEAPSTPTVHSPFMTYSDEPDHPTTPTQDTMEFTPAQAGAFRTGKNLEPQKITDKDEDKDVQKLFTTAMNKPIGSSAISVSLLLFAAVVATVRVRIRRGMQPPIALASSGRHEIDMSMSMEPFPVDNNSDLTCQGSPVRIPEQVLQDSERTLANDMHTHIKSPFTIWDSFGIGEAAPEVHVENVCESELQQGRAAMTAVFFVSPKQPRSFDGGPFAAATGPSHTKYTTPKRDSTAPPRKGRGKGKSKGRGKGKGKGKGRNYQHQDRIMGASEGYGNIPFRGGL